MKLTVLTENTCGASGFQAVHGLSLHVETDRHKILMDLGPGREFIENAKLLQNPPASIDLTQVDICAISHGHDDHGGGLRHFLEINHTAPVYLSHMAFGDYFAGSKYIGLDKTLKDHPQMRFVSDKLVVDEQITLLTKIPGDTLLPKANANLNDKNGPDPFLHEMVMLVKEGDTLMLLGGCAHRGIVNILEYVKDTVGRYPDIVVSGFHLAAGGSGKCMADDAYIDALAEKLMATGATFCSCHCTGLEALLKLQTRMPGKLCALSTAMGIET